MERAAVRAIPERETSVLAEPILSCGREICGDLASALARPHRAGVERGGSPAGLAEVRFRWNEVRHE